MSRALVIAAREVRERGFVFVAAGVMALIPFLATLLPKYRWAGPAAVVTTSGAMVSAGFAVALALMLGSSLVGRELSERRLSFYFSKPLSATALWFGKIAGGVVIIAVSFAITFLPSWLTGTAEWRVSLFSSVGSFVAVVLIGATYLLILSHAVGTMVRARSARAGIDLVVAIVLSFVTWMTLRPLLSALAMKDVTYVAIFIAAGFFVALLLAGAWQLSRGRSDIQRSHASLSLFLWSVAAIVVGVAAASVAWIVFPSPRDIELRTATQSPGGDWIAIGGPARHRGDYRAAFVMNIDTGRSFRFDASEWNGLSFTRGGEAVVAIAGENWSGPGELLVKRIDQPRSDGGTGIRTQTIWPAVSTSDDLRRVAVVDRNVLTVHDLSRHALLGSVRLPGADGWFNIFFTSPDIVRVYRIDRSNMQRDPLFLTAYEFDFRKRSLEKLGELHIDNPSVDPVNVSADGRTLLLKTGRALVVADARTLAPRFVVQDVKPKSAIVLENGQVAFVDDGTLRVFDPDGLHIRDIVLGSVSWASLREIVPGKKLLAATWRGVVGPFGGNRDVYVVDVERGVVERREKDSVLILRQHALADPRQPATYPSRYVIGNASAGLWGWDPLTGAKKRIL